MALNRPETVHHREECWHSNVGAKRRVEQTQQWPKTNNVGRIMATWVRVLTRTLLVEGLLKRPIHLLFAAIVWSVVLVGYLLRVPLQANWEYDVYSSIALKAVSCQRFYQKMRYHNENCPRFATLHHMVVAGLGHKIAEMVFAMNLALATNATFVLDTAIWDVHGAHGSYEWLPDMLPLTQTKNQITLSELRCLPDHSVQNIDGQWLDVVDKSQRPEHACNVLFTTRLDWCCGRDKLYSGEICWCTYSEELGVGAYNRVKQRMRETYAQSRYVPSQPLLMDDTREQVPENSLVMAWHVRGGDIVLNGREEYFDSVSSQLSTAIGELPMHVFFFGEQTLRYFPYLSRICKRHFGERCSFPDMEERVTLYYMVESDVLVTSGSSFASFAALLKADGIVLNAFNKDGVYGIYELPDQGMIGKDGSIIKPTLRELNLQLRAIYSEKMRS